MSQEHHGTDPQGWKPQLYPIEHHLFGYVSCTPECSVQTGYGGFTFSEGSGLLGLISDSKLLMYVHVSLKQIENIDACLGFLAAKGVNIKGLCAEGERTLN